MQPHGLKNTRWPIKYPLVKKNAAGTITQQYPRSVHWSKVTHTQCTSFLKFLLLCFFTLC